MSRRAEWYVGAGLAALAVVLVVVAGATTFGLTPDSAEYLFGAEHLVATGSYRAVSGGWQQSFPPGFPVLIAAVHLLGPSVETAARIVNAVSTGATVLLVFALLRAHLRSRWIVFGATALVAIAPPLVIVGATAWSEPLYVTWSTAALLALTADLARGTDGLRLVALAGILAGVATATRVLGASLVPAGLLLVAIGALHHRQRVAAALARAGVFVAAFVVAPSVWAIGNLVHGEPALGTHGRAVKGLSTNVRVVLANVTEWFLPADVPRAVRLLLLAAVLAVLVVVIGRAWLPVALTSGVVALSLVGFCTLAATRSGADVTPRVLTPALIPLVVCVAALVDRAVERRPSRALVAVVAACTLALGALFAVRTVDVLQDTGRAGYASDSWRRSEILAAVRRLDPDRMVFSTSPGATWLLTGTHPVTRWPTEASDRRGSSDTDDLAAFVAELRCLPGGSAYLLSVDRTVHERRFLPRNALERDVDLEPVAETPDGALWLARAHPAMHPATEGEPHRCDSRQLSG
jgi:4-amino-4-deoxy-L-arabinose transferase-like glycosyltransferase